jgi:phosphopantothenate synthetase
VNGVGTFCQSPLAKTGKRVSFIDINPLLSGCKCWLGD